MTSRWLLEIHWRLGLSSNPEVRTTCMRHTSLSIRSSRMQTLWFRAASHLHRLVPLGHLNPISRHAATAPCLFGLHAQLLKPAQIASGSTNLSRGNVREAWQPTEPHSGQIRSMSFQQRKYPRLDLPRTRWQLKVEAPHKGMKLAEFLVARIRWVDETVAAQLVQENRVSVVPRGVDTPAAAPRLDDELALQTQVIVETPAPAGLADPSQIPIEPLVDDGVLFAICKQPNLPVQPRGENDLDNVISALHSRYRTDDPATDRVPHLAHRIDADTSGVLLLLWDRKLSSRVQRQFEGREVKKQYLAIVHGNPVGDSGTIDVPLVSNSKAPIGQLMYYPGPDGKEALTDWEVVERFSNFALVRFFPHQGRTHQIRLHALHMGHPLLCDRLYGGGVAFSDIELVALESAQPPARLPFSVKHSGDGSGKLQDLLDSADLEVMSPALARARSNGEGVPIAEVLSGVRSGVEPVDRPRGHASRCMLHSNVLELRHPATGAPTRIEAQIPDDMAQVLALLRHDSPKKKGAAKD